MARCVQLKLRVQYLQYNSYCRDTCSYHPVASSAKTNQEGLDTRSLILLPLKPILLTTMPQQQNAILIQREGRITLAAYAYRTG